MNQNTLRTAHILVVDDNISSLALMTAAIKIPDTVVHTLSASRECIPTLETIPVDLIVLDINMPSPNGFELAKLIKLDSRFTDIPIVFLTSRDSDPDTIIRSFETGVVDYIQKPIDFLLLQKKLEALIRLHRDKATLENNAMSYRRMIKSIL